MLREEQKGKSELTQFVKSMDCLQMKMTANLHRGKTKTNATKSVKKVVLSPPQFCYLNFVLAHIFTFEILITLTL